MTTPPSIIIVGAGPAGLAAAHELVRNDVRCTVLEKGDRVGGIARTETYKGFRFDIGGHRFYTKVPVVQKLWEDALGDEFLRRPRLSRIYYNGRFFNYPLSIWNVLGNLGIWESLRILGSYCRARLRPGVPEDSFEQWVTNRFGDRLYRTFFKTYTEKVWGIPCSEIRADWAAQRIKGLSLVSAVANALFGSTRSKSLINEFEYPRLGPGQMWEAVRDIVEAAGSSVHVAAEVKEIICRGFRVEKVQVVRSSGEEELPVDHLVTSMPVTKLLESLRPAPPTEVLQAGSGLQYRDFLIVTLIIDQRDLFPDNWIYVHSPRVRVGRIQNFKNWSPDMVPDPAQTCVGMEYFCSISDDLWNEDDARLVELARDELVALGLAKADDIRDGCVIRQPKAYPVYDTEYRAHLEVIRAYLERFENLQTVGRNGMHRYNNQDHSMLCGIYAAQNILGASHDLWDVNTERSYYEEQRIDESTDADPTGSSRVAVERGT